MMLHAPAATSYVDLNLITKIELLILKRLAGGTTGGGRTSMAACGGDFGATNQAAKIEAFFRATASFHEAAFQAASELMTACQSTGRALGMTDAELTGDLRTVCTAAHEPSAAVAAQLPAQLPSQTPEQCPLTSAAQRPVHCASHTPRISPPSQVICTSPGSTCASHSAMQPPYASTETSQCGGSASTRTV